MNANPQDVRPPINTRVVAENIPGALRELDQCVCWLAKWQPEKGKWSKIPLQPNGLAASSTNPVTWSTASECLAAHDEDGRLGFGFVVTSKDPIVGIDLDHVRDPDSGDIEPWALETIRALDSYTEVSPSGTGIRIFVKGKIPESVLGGSTEGRKKDQIEVYQAGRFLTVTGQHLEGTPRDIEERQVALTQLCERHFSRRGAAGKTYTVVDGEADQAAVNAKIDALCGSDSRFISTWNRTRDEFGDQSASTYDLALANAAAAAGWTDAEIWLLLYLWRQKHGEDTEKLKREDYFASTVGKARDSSKPGLRRLTDFGNAERFIDLHGENVRYFYALKKWAVWNCRRWVFDDSGQIMRWAIKTVRLMYSEAADIADEKLRDALLKHAKSSEALPRLEALIKVARSLCPLSPEALDSNPWLLGVANGTVDLRTGILCGPRRGDYITKCTGVIFDPAATCPRWLAFLDRIFHGVATMVAYLQRIVGYTLTGQCTEQCLFFLHGPGANGKSVFVAVLQALLGDYAASTRTETLMVNNNTGGANNDVARLRGARVVTATETEAGQRWAESRIKQITGGDRISARFLYGEYFEYLPQFKLFVAGNHKPRIGGDDEAIWRRLKVLPFTVIIPEDERDPELTQRLLAELPGILNWAIEGCLLWQKNGLMTPKTVRQSTQLYREDQDVFRQWFADCCELRLDDPKTVASAADLHDSHTDWCKDANEMPLSRRELGFRLSDTGAKRVKRNGRKHYEGILLLDNPRRF